MTKTRNSLGELIRFRRKELKLTQEELGNLAGLNRLTISEYERGQVSYPRFETLELLADALGVPASDLVAVAYQQMDNEV